jgi:hypothetical protein
MRAGIYNSRWQKFASVPLFDLVVALTDDLHSDHRLAGFHDRAHFRFADAAWANARRDGGRQHRTPPRASMPFAGLAGHPGAIKTEEAVAAAP